MVLTRSLFLMVVSLERKNSSFSFILFRAFIFHEERNRKDSSGKSKRVSMTSHQRILSFDRHQPILTNPSLSSIGISQSSPIHLSGNDCTTRRRREHRRLRSREGRGHSTWRGHAHVIRLAHSASSDDAEIVNGVGVLPTGSRTSAEVHNLLLDMR